MHYEIKYDHSKKKLTIFHNGRLLGGMIGKIAEERFLSLKDEMKKIDYLKAIDGHKAKKAKV